MDKLNIMNIFKKAIKIAKEAVNEFRIKSKIEAEYKIYIAEKQKRILECENDIQDAIVRMESFDYMMSLYEELQILKEDIVDAEKFYNYLFDEEEKTIETKNN